jgi:TonB-linked SusC/RagA family outer membrane protein
MNISLFSNGVVRYALILMKFTSLACFVVCFMCLSAVANDSFGQRFLEASVTLKLKNARLTEALEKISADKHIKFAYADNVLKPDFRVSLNAKNKSIKQVLTEVLSPFNLSYKVIDDVVVIDEKTELDSSTGGIQQTNAAIVKITGRVTDENGQPFPGVSVKIKNTSTGTLTNVDGSFTLDVPASEDVLVFSFLGYTPKEVPVNGKTTIIIQLTPERTALNEVVVVGYGTQKRVNVIGAVDQISSKDIESKPSVNLTQALQGTSPNLIIQQTNSEPGAYQTINIRGVSTFGNNNPLIVIDGITGGDINLLNPQDIESVSVLKDAGSAAIYGSRAANGVILVTTKKGKKNSDATISYNGQGGVQVPHVGYKPVHAYENAILRNEAVVNAGLQPIYSPAQIREFQQNGDNQWFLDAILKNAVLQNHNVAVTGGNSSTSYLVSAGVTDQRSNLVGPNYGLRRYNYRMNLTTEVGKLKLTSILAYARTEIKEHSFSTGTLIVDAGRTPTYYKIKDDQGNYLTNDVLTEFNPLGILEKGGYRKRDNDNIFGNLNAELSITKDLKIKGVFGGTVLANHLFARVIQVNYLPKGTYGSDRNTDDDNNKNLFLNTQLLAQYTKTFNKDHNVDVLVGVANESTTNTSNFLHLKFTDPELGTPIEGTTIVDPSSTGTNNNKNESSLNSLFGRASYSYKNRYYTEFDFRVDASSKFNKQNRNAFFPSVTAGYRITEENFMQNYRDKFGDLKLRASYGILGNQNVGDYQFLNTYGTYQDYFYGFNNQSTSATQINFANTNIRWERASTFNIGIDAGFFKNALTISADYFNKITRDILLPPIVPGTFGSGLPDYNAGEVQNRGWELNIAYRLNTGNFKHSFAFNVGDTKNKVLKLEGGDQLKSYDEMQIINKVGLPIGSYVGLKRDGYFQNLDDITNGAKPAGLNVLPGDNRYVDVNKDGVIDDNDKFVLGNGFPRLTFGFTYNVNFKQFDFNMFMQGVGKRSMFIRGEQVEPFHFNYSQVIYQHQLDYWTPQNPDARYPRLAANGSQSNENNFRRGSDMYLFDGSYLRVKNVQLGYTLPQSIAKKVGMQKVRAYVSGQNVLTFSGMKFLDPESTELGGNVTANGANSGRSYPTPIYYGFGIDLTL